jgi:hypothetical protein
VKCRCGDYTVTKRRDHIDVLGDHLTTRHTPRHCLMLDRRMKGHIGFYYID